MIEEKTVEVVEINSYRDLKLASIGQIISIKGKNPEQIINPFSEYSDYGFFNKSKYHQDKIYTVGIEGNFLVENQYDKYVGDSDEFLIPFFKRSCRIGSGTALENVLSKIVEREGLKNGN